MVSKLKCSRCGKDVDRLCSACWRCKDCKIDCDRHMERGLNATVGEPGKKK